MPAILPAFVLLLSVIGTLPAQTPVKVCVAQSTTFASRDEAGPVATALSRQTLRSGRAVVAVPIAAEAGFASADQLRASACDYLVRLQPVIFPEAGMNVANDAASTPSAAGPDRDYPVLNYQIFPPGEARAVAHGVAIYQWKSRGHARTLQMNYPALAARIAKTVN